MPRPKATSRSTTSRARSAPSAAFRRSSPTAFRWRWCDSIERPASPRATPTASASAARTDEPGEAIGRIGARTARRNRRRFRGLHQRHRTSERKILRNVFARGDAWFRTGDLMRKDADGFFYFVDRIGDTFRWKGENVATSEVAAAIAAFPGIAEATVYGVAVPGTEGAPAWRRS